MRKDFTISYMMTPPKNMAIVIILDAKSGLCNIA